MEEPPPIRRSRFGTFWWGSADPDYCDPSSPGERLKAFWWDKLTISVFALTRAPSAFRSFLGRFWWHGVATVALVLLTVTAWPLGVSLYGLIPGSVPWGRIALGVLLVGAFVFALVQARPVKDQSPESSAPMWLGWLIAFAWLVAMAAVVVMAGLMWVFLGMPGISPPSQLSPGDLDAIATRAFAVVAGLGGVAVLMISYRRQLTTEAAGMRAEEAANREVTKLFNERFTVAYNDLGSEHAAVRLGAVYALAHLADDAPTDDLTQMVIDVLCAYLRMPYAPVPEPLPKNASKKRREEHREQELDFAAFREVRHTIIRIVGDRLRRDTAWRGKDYDFTGATFDGGDLHGARFTGGTVSFSESVFSGGRVDFRGSGFSGGTVDFGGAVFSGGKVEFGRSIFSDGWVGFRGAKFSDGVVDFAGAEVLSESPFFGPVVDFRGAVFAGGQVNFPRTRFSGGQVDFAGAVFAGGQVDFGGRVEWSGYVDSDGAEFSGGQVGFLRAEFSDGVVDFAGALFVRGPVDFAAPGNPEDDAQGRCPDGLLESIRAGAPGVVTLPAAWQEDASPDDGAVDAPPGDS